jgi:hypothetical protein
MSAKEISKFYKLFEENIYFRKCHPKKLNELKHKSENCHRYESFHVWSQEFHSELDMLFNKEDISIEAKESFFN